MYELGDVLPETRVDPGTNLLVSGPPMVDKRRIALEVLSAGAKRGDGSVVVTTKDSADRVLEEFARTAAADAGPVGVVDCVSRQQGLDGLDDGPRVKYASSPVDMTGIGIALSEFLEEFQGRVQDNRHRVLLHSLSTMLMYSDLQTVFRFLHVFSGRIQSVDGLGLYVIDATAHDDRTMSTLKQLFDGIVTVEQGEDGPAVSLRGNP
ncbi:MAG: recombinase RecA [Halobacteriales archaeon]